MVKRKLADELADLFNPAPQRDADPEAFGLGVDSTAATAADDDEQLEAMHIAGQPSAKKARESSRRLRADIDVEDEQYRGRRSSRAAVFGEEEDEAKDGVTNNESPEGEDEEDEEGEESEEGDESEEGGEGEMGEGEEEEEGDDEQGYDGDLALKRKLVVAAGASRELAELQRQYEAVQQEEPGVMGLKQRSEKEKTKGEAVLHQQKLYDRSLELRILLQKALQGSLRLPLGPLPPAAAAAAAAGEKAAEEQEPVSSTSVSLRPVYLGLSSLRREALDTLQDLLGLQQALLKRNDAITSQMDPVLLQQLSAAPGSGPGPGAASHRSRSKAASGAAVGSAAEAQECWEQLEQLNRASAPYRNSSLDRWHRRTVLMMGGGSTKGEGSQLRALNQSISSQVAAALKDPTRLIQRSRVPADSCPRPLGTAAAAAEPDADADAAAGPGAADPGDGRAGPRDGEGEAGCEEWLASSYDDGEFYQQLLREFLARSGAGAAIGAASGAGKRRRVVDRRASKGRKVRYQVHDKMVNFMTPVALEPPAFAAQLFSNLFGSSAGPLAI